MKDKTQKVKSYISGAGVTVYEIVQFNKKVGKWYTVGDCTENKNWADMIVIIHNTKLIKEKVNYCSNCMVSSAIMNSSPSDCICDCHNNK